MRETEEMFAVYYYHEKLQKWIKACRTMSEESARDECAVLQQLWGQPTRYEKE